MKYVKPDLDIIEFDEELMTSTQLGGSDVSTGSNEDNLDVSDDTLWD